MIRSAHKTPTCLITLVLADGFHWKIFINFQYFTNFFYYNRVLAMQVRGHYFNIELLWSSTSLPLSLK